jgi:hypothetical protein
MPAPRASDTRESRAAEAERRRGLEGNTMFENLGEPIQRLLLSVSKDVSSEDMKLLSKVTVRQLAKVFDMLALEEDPEKILVWIRKEALRAQGINVDDKKIHNQRVATNATRDAVAFYKELEKKNMELIESMKNAQKDREEKRTTNIAERRRRREEAVTQAAEAKQRALESGETVASSKSELRKSDLSVIVGAFSAAAKRSNADNSGAAQDTEWWKQDQYRREFEKAGRKSTAWTRVIEGGSQPAIEAELASREEWFRSQCWWKSEKYKRDWAASKDAEWWKEETYIKDWQEHGEKGAQWTAADEVSGFNRKGDRRRAADVELSRRVQWYKDNGPKGIVKMWCASTESSAERCTLEEKRERDDYFKNGDWWKSERNKLALADSADPSVVTFAGSAGEDREWWKDDSYRKSFASGGDNWKRATEKCAVTGQDIPCSAAEQARREEWFADNWWKADKYREDYKKHGEKGKLWRAVSEADAANPEKGKLLTKEQDLRVRADWFRSADDREWWKDEKFLRDYQEHGAKGKMWTGAWKEAGDLAKGDKDRATPQQLAEREQYYKANWWKAEKYVKDFQVNGKAGSAWKAGSAAAHEDRDWWKQGEYMRKFAAAKKANLDAFWMDPKCVEDYFVNGKDGKRWQAANAAAASVEKGDVLCATPEQIKEREQFYEENWWRSPEATRDFATNGADGKIWTAEERGGKTRASPEELAQRRLHFAPHTAASPAYDAMFESDAAAPVVGEFAKPNEVRDRQETMKKDWWKSPKVREDFLKHGKNGALFKAATQEVAALGLGDDPKYQASPADLDERATYFESGKDDTQWWQDDEHQREAAEGRDPTFWKNPEYVEDYLKNGANGKKWNAANAAAGSVGKGDEVPATPEELAEREEYFKNAFWKAPEYQADFEKNGEQGTLWQQSLPGGKGTTVSEAERKARMAFYKPKSAWQLQTKPVVDSTKIAHCTPAEALDRREWFEKNWWKAPEVKEDFLKHGRKSKLLRAATQEAAELGLSDTDPLYQASPDEIEERAQYFETCGDNEWWKDPAVVEDFVKHGKDGAAWQARNFHESQLSMGKESPATQDELDQRQEWFEKNFWRTPAALDDFVKNGNKGSLWKSGSQPGADGSVSGTPATAEEIEARRQWFETHAPVSQEEVMKRREWLERQLTDEEKVARRTWVKKSAKESTRISTDELGGALAAFNDGEAPTEEQLKAIMDHVKKIRKERGFEPATQDENDTLTQEEFVSAVADTNFYVPQTDEERLRAEEEALEAMQQEEMNRVTEEAAYLAMEAEEEREKAGLTEEDVAALAAAQQHNDEEAAFLDDLEEDGLEAKPNEDDVQMTADEEAAWNDFLETKEDDGAATLTPEEEARLAAEEEQRLAAAAAAEEDWENADYAGEEEDWAENPDGAAPLVEARKDELEALVEEDPEEQWGGEEEDWGEEEAEPEEEIDEMQMEEKGQPLQWKLPLPEVTNPQYLKSYFTVIKYTPSHSLLGGKQKRVWVVDHFTRCFYNLDKSGKIKKEHAANKLLQLERNVADPNRLRLMFFDAAHSYELQFYSPQERERFYESASAIRPSIRVYAPDLTNQDANVEACTTIIDGVGPNTVSVTCNNAAGKPVARELTGECKVNASKLLTEPLTIWVGTFNLTGHHPPRKSDDLNEWMPKDKYDIYAVAVQEASYRKEESDWFEYVQHHLGKEYLTLASMSVWDTLLIVLSRKKHLLKITNVEGSTKATVHKSVCGTKGGIGISLRYLETSMAFVTCHLAARLERNAMRNTNIEEVIDGLQLAIRETDICNQFNHVFMFGDFNYRVELDNSSATEMIDAKQYASLMDYDQLTQQRRDEGILHGFQEPPITFAPTYRMQVGSDQYMAEKGNAPSYCARVLTRSMANTWVKCTGYRAFRSVQVSEHQPVNATFIVRCVRPTMSCFMKQQSPIPQFIFEELAFTESTGPIIKKPQLLIYSPFTGIGKNIEAVSGQTSSPSWSGNLPRMESVTQAQEYLETCHFIFIVREAAEKREDKAHRGTAHLTLFSRVIGAQDMQQEFDADIMAHGRCIGKLVGKFRWEAAPLAM